MKKFIIAAIFCVLTAVIIIGGITGYIYYDFSANGADSSTFYKIDEFDKKVFLEIDEISAFLKDNTLTVSSTEDNYNNIRVYATIRRSEETDTLILQVNQRVSPCTPFKMQYVSFTNGNQNSSGEYTTWSDIYQTGYDKNGNKLTLQPAGSNGINELGIHTTEYFLRYADDGEDGFGKYLKPADIENAFPISVSLEGHEVNAQRVKLF